jgi:type I restriction enzyme S subunit
MMSNWWNCKLGDLLEIKHGFAFLGEHFANTGSHIVLTPGNFFDEGGFKHKGENEKWYNGLIPKDYVLNEGDLIVAMTEQAEGLLGSSAIVPRSGLYLHNQRLGLVQIRDEKKADKRFLYYLFNSKPVRQQIRSSATGTKIRHTAPSRIAEVKISVPPFPMQLRIAGILSAYDDLIENNLRRIRILEEMARSIYREWFVNFRFPDHEKISLVDSPIGPIPEGWKVNQVPECIEVNPRVVVPKGYEVPFVPMGSLANDSMPITGTEMRLGNGGAKFRNGDTLFARITPCLENGKTGFVQFLADEHAVACGSTEFIVLRSKTLTPEFVYCLARSEEFRGNAIKSMSGASGRQRVQENCFDRFHVVRPTPVMLDRFSSIAGPSFRLIHKLHLQTENLRRSRDLLLPRLLSGVIGNSRAADLSSFASQIETPDDSMQEARKVPDST